MSQTRRFWVCLLLVFGAMRLADALNAVTGLWVVPSRLPAQTLGALLPLTQFGAVLALPVSVLTTVFARHLGAYAAAGDAARVRALLRGTLAATGLALAAALAVATTCLPWLCDALRVAHSPAGYLAVAYGLIAAFLPMVTAAAQALERFGALAAGSLLAAPMRLGVMFMALPLLGLTGYFIGQLTPVLVTAGVTLWALRRLLARGAGAALPASAVWREAWRPMARYAGKVALGIVAASLQTFVATLVIRTRLADDASAGYYILSRFAEIATYCGSTVAMVLFPYAVAAQTRGEGSATLRDGALAAILGGGLLLAGALWVCLPWFFPFIPGYAPYVGIAPLAAYLTVTTTLNVACAGHFAHQQARNDFRYLRYMLPCAALACLALTLCPIRTLPAILHLLFACALLQALCVAVDLWRSHGRA